MFYYVYILKTKKKHLYTGFTKDLRRRYLEHTQGKVQSTASMRPLQLIHYEAYLIKSDAIRREKFLKTTEGKRLLRKQLKDLLSQ